MTVARSIGKASRHKRLWAVAKAWLFRRRYWRPARPPGIWHAPILLDNIADPRAQMEFIARVEFEPKRLLNKSEYKLLLLLESVACESNARLRVMAQTSMGELIRPKSGSAPHRDCSLAYRSINSKRIDFVVIDRFGIPMLAIEYQGNGHYHRHSFMRDAVKREALRKANVRFLEVPNEYEPLDLKNQIRTLLKARSGG